MRYEILCKLLMRSKLALVLIATGILVPLISIPSTKGYRRNAGVIENIQSMSVVVEPAGLSPDFRAIDLPDAAPSPSPKPPFDPSKPFEVAAEPRSDESESADAFVDRIIENERPDLKPDLKRIERNKRVDYGNTGIHIYFSSWFSDDEIKGILKSGKQQIESANSKNLGFYGWTVPRPESQLPFSLVVSGSLLLVLLGVVMLIFSRRPS